VSAQQAVLTSSLSATAVRGTLTIAPQNIAFEGLTGSIAGGTLNADARFHTTPGGLSARSRVSLANADVASLLRANMPASISGRVSAKLEMDGTGSNPAALVGSLTGSGSVTLENVQIAGVDPKAIDIASRAFERGTAVTPARIGDLVARIMDQGSLSLPWVTAPLAVTAGRIRLGKLVTPPQSNELAASASFDLLDSTLDARLTVSGIAEAGQRPEVSVLLKGPAAAVRRSVDVSALTNWLTLRSADREAKQIEAAQRAAKQLEKLSPAGSGQPAAAPRDPQAGTDLGANLPAAPAHPTAPALPPPVTLTRPPGASPVRPAPPLLTAPPLFTPQ
jgi:large subunit ribosomal protein L24